MPRLVIWAANLFSGRLEVIVIRYRLVNFTLCLIKELNQFSVSWLLILSIYVNQSTGKDMLCGTYNGFVPTAIITDINEFYRDFFVID